MRNLHLSTTGTIRYGTHNRKKNNRRYRVQFTIRRELHEIYEAYMARAAALHLLIDFGHDFEKWFENQLQQVGQELDRLEARQPQNSLRQ